MRALVSLSILTFCLISQPVLAECTSESCKGKLAMISVNPLGAYVRLAETELKGLHCNPKKGKYLTLKLSHPNYSQLFNGLYTARSLNQEVLLKLSKGANECEIAFINP